MKVLIIEDNKDLATMLSRILEVNRHNCIVSNDGKNGLSLLQSGKFDAVVLDLGMPEFTGFDVIDALEKDGRLKEQKIIVLTAKDLPKEEIEELKRRGVHACFKKPVSMDVLAEALQD